MASAGAEGESGNQLEGDPRNIRDESSSIHASGTSQKKKHGPTGHKSRHGECLGALVASCSIEHDHTRDTHDH